MKGGYGFHSHAYYTIGFVPVMAAVAGHGLSNIGKRGLKIGFLCLIIIECLANQQHDFFIKDSQRYKLDLEAVADSVSDRNDLIIYAGGLNPQPLYFTHRKGWPLENEKLENRVLLDSLADLGATNLFVDRKSYAGEILHYPMVYEDENTRVYLLK